MKTEKLIEQIQDIVNGTDWEKVLLFGSYASGSANDESDLDLYVVTKDDFLPKNYEDKLRLKTQVSKRFSKLREHYSLDLIVHTYPMYEKFRLLESSFSRNLFKEGISIR